MWYLLRRLMGCCVRCGQKNNQAQTTAERVAELNKRSGRLAKSLGRWPQVQCCKSCGRLLFEGETGYTPSFLLIDIDYCCPVLYETPEEAAQPISQARARPMPDFVSTTTDLRSEQTVAAAAS